MTEGIYMIHCVPTGDVYIGSSSRIEARWVDHKSALNRGVHHSKKLQDVWSTLGSESFTHEVLEITLDLAARELHWMEVYKEKLLNTSEATWNPMRNQEYVDKMLATRGDKQTGVNSSSAKLTEDKYLQIFYALATTTYSAEDLSDYFGLSPRSIRDIAKGSRHAWIRENYPKQFDVMQNWRNNLRTYRATDQPSPEIDIGIDTTFANELHSFRRSYQFKSEATKALERIEQLDNKEARARASKERQVLERQLANLPREEVEKAKEKAKAKKRPPKVKKRKPWISLVNKSGEHLEFFSAEEATAYGLSVKFLTQLKSKTIIRYKGWILA
jgi:predicted GIY-YIG superfamily endonuclease